MKCQPPYRETLKTKITHVVTTKESTPDLLMLHRSGFQDIWYPEYIADYLIMHVSIIADIICIQGITLFLKNP